MSTSTKNAARSKDSPPFEEALQNLEQIVSVMEAGDLPLEGLLARFEEGTRLVKICQAQLAEAELKIQKLEKNAAGETVLQPLEPESTPPDE